MESNNVLIKERRVFKVGKSYVVTLPREWIDFFKIQNKNLMKVRIKIFQDHLVLEPVFE